VTLTKIKELAGFFYSSNSAADVPLRISCTTGQYSGFDLDRQKFIELLVILHRSHELKKDLADFRERHHE
jgi:hypothetical protein